MWNPNKEISAKYLAPALIFIVVAVPIIFAIFGEMGFFIILAMVLLFVFRKKFFSGFNSSNFLNNIKNMSSQNRTESSGEFSPKMGGFWKAAKIIIAVLLAIWVISWFVEIIGAGETGVYVLFGRVRDRELSSGFHFVNPLAKIQKMNIRTEQYTMSIAPGEGQKTGNDAISALTKEGLDVNIDFTALYHLDEPKASDIYREVGLDYVDKIIRPEIRGIIRTVVSQYEAKELYSEKRQEASQRIFSDLKEKLDPRGVILEEAVIRNVGLPASLAKAIQEKLAAEQEAQRYDFVLDKEKKEADRKRIEAEGQRDAQKIIDESLSAEYLNYLYIKELKDRQGTVYVPVDPSSGMPLFKGL